MNKFKQFGINLADIIANFVGSWTFIIIQSIVLMIWVYANADHLVNFDPYPFILMNLFLSFQAAYATPMILMSSNRQANKDREHLIKDVQLDEETNKMIKTIHEMIQKLDQDIQLNKQALKDHESILEELKKISKKKTKE